MQLNSDKAVNETVDNLARMNRAFWQALPPKAADRGFVAVRVESHPVVQLCNLSFGAVVAYIRQARPLFILTQHDPAVEALAASYPGAELLFLDDKRFEWLRRRADLRAAVERRMIKSPQELLDYECDGIRFGDVIYDEVLAQGYATLDKIDGRTEHAMREFFRMRLIMRYIFKRYNINCAVLSHFIGSQGAAFARYMIKAGKETLVRIGSHQLLIKKCRTLQDIGTYPVKPDPVYFERMMRDDDGTILRLAEDYIERRFGSRIDHTATNVAYDSSKKVYQDAAEFCEDYGLDPSKPLVFVMLHAFNDFPHSHFYKRMIYQDYYDWFVKTLEVARQTDTVNWVFKRHPADKYYATQDVDVAAMFANEKSAHIAFLDSETAFNTRSIAHIAKALTTCLGTAGLEFSTQGIPCILAGESGYSGLGFTCEPRDRGEYEAILRNAAELQKLSDEQVRAAKLVAYFFFCVMENSPYHFCPRFSDAEIFEWKKNKSDILFRRTIEAFGDSVKTELLKQQILTIESFLNSDMRRQYVDFAKFPCLNEPLGKPKKD